MADPNIVQLEHTSINEEIQIVSRNSSPTQTYSTSSPQANNNQEPPTGSSPQAHNQEPPAAQVVVDIDDEDGNETTNITNDGEVFVDIDEDDNEPTNTTPDDEEDEIETTNENSCRFIAAVLAGDERKAMNTFLESREEIVRTRIGFNGETAFHMAVLSAKEKNVAHVVKKILKIMETEFLAIGNSFGTNALHYAAASGNWEITKLIHLKNPGLANAFNNHNLKPIFLAATAGHSDVIKFLLGVTTLFAEDDHHASSVLKYCIKASLFDIAVDIVQNRCPLAATWDNGGDENTQTALEVLAEMPSSDDHKHCSSVKKLLDAIWPILKESDLYKTSYLENLLLTSAKKGNHEFIVYLLRHYPGLINTMDSSRHTIFHIAIVHRHEKIFTLIHEIGSLKDYIATYQDINNDSMLHLAAKLSPPNQLNRVHGAALQMQRELLWYKEVEKIVPPGYVELENDAKKTPHDIFIEDHLELMKSGEKWMKRTTQFSMVVSTLIATVVFTTAFTIPGGINNNGAPYFKRTKFFDMFVISEIMSMICSSISIVMYLCILTSRYTENAFLKSLPLWLTMGTVTLFISLTSMLVAFCSAFLVFKSHDKYYMPILLGFLALAPVMFIGFKFPLFVDIIKTTTSSKSLSRSRRKLFPRKRWYSCKWLKLALQMPFISY